MSFIEFTEENRIGIAEIDEQHRNLFTLLNTMHTATIEGQEHSAIVAIFDDLIVYTVEHFDTEEKYMQEYQYPQYTDHKKEHDDLTGQALQLQMQFNSGSATVTFELLDFLNGWLNDHTMGTDRELGDFLRPRLANRP
ncbi:bacteriohemerythrin [Pseudodesulfovibrio sp. JC047]|uniref:bacteriohemerythrin n=1 Tax=Pseudodesulfovibrio sp. JC047 TaxID=2683199 RepID=UPI0013D595A7|nr:bacteriohemerythrin [Pseudodesulfovibrio sp. JC047]NDV19723.1 bacteriohemerythrin [Pseudodesulfovibrio sp. JC047]